MDQRHSADDDWELKEAVMKTQLILNFITPFVLICVGAMLKRHPQHDMSRQNGYNTPTARKSQAHWDYAQKIAPDIYISFGKWMLPVKASLCLLALVLSVSASQALVIGSGIDIAVLVYSFIYTDAKIKKAVGL